MKWLFLLLFVANLAFFGFTKLEVAPPPIDFKSREINADKLTLIPVEPPKPAPLPAPALPPDAIPAAVDAAPADAKPEAKADAKADAKRDDKTDAKPAKVEQACFAWHGILSDDLPNVRKKVAGLKLGGDTHLQSADGDAKVRYWVFIPPRPSTSDAQKKADELKGLGVGDYYVVNDGSKWQNAISLGLFSSKEAAERRLTAIRDQGVRTAQMQERSEGNVGVTLLVKNVPKSAKGALEKAATSFRGSSVSEGC